MMIREMQTFTLVYSTSPVRDCQSDNKPFLLFWSYCYKTFCLRHGWRESKLERFYLARLLSKSIPSGAPSDIGLWK